MDLMRVASALLIFYYHAGLLISLPLSSYGDHAVSTFIMLAVVSSMTFARRADDAGFGNYLWRRLKRIFPIVVYRLNSVLWDYLSVDYDVSSLDANTVTG